ncbi:MAG: hypothetical protein EA376_04610 [Phycisphaeraceae bacterium]|nr:MAG: hypothetical protein EA376_04610 [Phycisphaeraceae bacterium]
MGVGASAAHAGTTMLNTVDRGWISSEGVANDSLNYVAGESDITSRNWFGFNLTGLSGVVESATFSVLIDSQFGITNSGVYEFRDVSTPFSSFSNRIGGGDIFDDLGDGDVFGSIAFDESLMGQMISISLNSDGLAMLTDRLGSMAVLGGFVVDDLVLPLEDRSSIFGFSSGLTPTLTLEVREGNDNGDGGMGVIPIPSAAGLGAAGLALLTVGRRRRA